MEAELSTGGGTGPRRGSRSVALLTWALAATLAGAVVWWAVATIGGSAGAGVLTESQVAALAGQVTAHPAASTQSTLSTQSIPSTPWTQPGGPGSTGPTATPPETTALPTTGPGVAEVARTWDALGGQVGVSCLVAQIRLLYATPQDGWTVVVESAGPEGVEVHFVRGAVQSAVRAVCAGGGPEQTSSTSGDHGGEDG